MKFVLMNIIGKMKFWMKVFKHNITHKKAQQKQTKNKIKFKQTFKNCTFMRNMERS